MNWLSPTTQNETTNHRTLLLSRSSPLPSQRDPRRTRSRTTQRTTFIPTLRGKHILTEITAVSQSQYSYLDKVLDWFRPWHMWSRSTIAIAHYNDQLQPPSQGGWCRISSLWYIHWINIGDQLFSWKIDEWNECGYFMKILMVGMMCLYIRRKMRIFDQQIYLHLCMRLDLLCPIRIINGRHGRSWRRRICTRDGWINWWEWMPERIWH